MNYRPYLKDKSIKYIFDIAFNMPSKNAIKNYLYEKKNDIYYSYWFDEWVRTLSILKSKKKINHYHCKKNKK